jgi:hypothetical protein
VFAADALTLLLTVGVVVLVVSTAVMATGYATARPGRSRRGRRGRRASNPVAPSAARSLEVARARAAVHQADQRRELATAAAPARPLPTGQIIDISDGRRQGRTMSVEYAQALAEHVAENDPHRVAEVINQWIRADSTDPLELFR